jgi:tetratricopeptide (TPR) repeat protein
MHPSPSQKTRVRRRWRVPPPLAHGDDVLEGLSVLDDVQGELGIVLWQALRDASLWAAASPKARSGIFGSSAQASRVASLLAVSVPRELEGPLSALAAMTGAPESVGEASVALALREVSLWLDERGLLGSALAFAHAGATVAAGDAAAAFTVGRLARRRAEHVRAETWFRRAALLARQGGDWASYTRALMGLGALYLQRGNLPVAYRFRRRALHATERRALHELRGTAHHDLFEVTIHMDRPAEAQEQARLALQAYGTGHARVPMLAHDVAYFWMTRGQFGRALALFGAILPHFEQVDARALVLACHARAAGGAGREAEFRRSWARLSLLRPQLHEERRASVLLEAARGAVSMGAWMLAEEAALEALAVAERRAAGADRLEAEALLDQATRRMRAAPHAAPVHADVEGAAESLAGSFMDSLAAGVA